MQLRILLICLLPLVALAQEQPREIPLWPGGAPGFEDRRDEPQLGKHWWIRNIHNGKSVPAQDDQHMAAATGGLAGR